MAICVFRDEPCDRTNIEARGLSRKHYERLAYHHRLDEYPRSEPVRTTHDCPRCRRPGVAPGREYCSYSCFVGATAPSYELARTEGRLLCQCSPPKGGEGDECTGCRRLILHDAGRIAYLRTLAALRNERGAA